MKIGWMHPRYFENIAFFQIVTDTSTHATWLHGVKYEGNKSVCFFVSLPYLFFSFYYSMHPISFVNKTIKNDHAIALYEFIIELSKKIPSCASLI